jgi:hypothetical protein
VAWTAGNVQDGLAVAYLQKVEELAGGVMLDQRLLAVLVGNAVEGVDAPSRFLFALLLEPDPN